MPAADECWFDHEKLEVYRDTIAFVAWLYELLGASTGDTHGDAVDAVSGNTAIQDAGNGA